MLRSLGLATLSFTFRDQPFRPAPESRAFGAWQFLNASRHPIRLTMPKRAGISAPTSHKPTVLEETGPSTSISKQPETSGSAAPSTFKIIVGTYEKLLYGLEGRVESSKESPEQLSVSLNPIFIFPAHVACVRAVAASPQGGKWLATGSTDEIIKVWDLRRRKEIGGLVQHQGMHSILPSGLI
jgi:protein MAK11